MIRPAPRQCHACATSQVHGTSAQLCHDWQGCRPRCSPANKAAPTTSRSTALLKMMAVVVVVAAAAAAAA
jgi:hypothetical protein